MKIIIAGASAVGTIGKIVVSREAGHHIDGRQ